MIKKVKAFDMVAEAYDDWYNHPQGKQVFTAERNAINFMIPSEGLGIEIGAGTGAFAQSLQRDNRVIVCLDPSISMVSEAKKKNLHIILGYSEYSPFRSVFTFAYMVTVIEFLDHPVSTLLDIKKICKHNTPLILLFINANSSWGTFYSELGTKGDPVFQQARLYRLDEIIEIFEKAKYKVKKTTGTLLSDPMDPEVISDLIDPSDEAGVIILKSTFI
jgi:ubiquinone/menaquinone biosynthesis C-methylase UbiE